MTLWSTSGPNLRRCTTIFLTLSTFLLASFALPLPTSDDSITPVTCVPANFKSVFIFFFVNYVAHAATVPSVAGRPTISVFWIIGSLFYPFFGLIRSFILFFHYILAEDEVGKAISQGAVMVAARSRDWVPRFTRNELIYVGLLREFPENLNTDSAELPKARFHIIPDIYASSTFGSTPLNAVKTGHVTLNGEASLPKGYFWSKPEIRQLNALASHTLKREGIRVGRTKNTVKGLASVAQLVFSSITLYRTRGSQIQRYGYTAFGLSVFPYALMSFVNLIVLTIVGEYSTFFVLRTAISDEAKRCGGTISGEIGTLPEKSPVEEGRSSNGMEIGDDGEDRHVTPLPDVDDSNVGTRLGKCDGEKENLLGEANKTTTGTPPEAKDVGSVGTVGERTDGSVVPMPENPAVFLSGEPLIAAHIRMDEDGVLVITMKGRTRRFKLIEGDDTSDDDPLTFHFHVSSLTNQEKVPKREEPAVTLISLIYILFALTLALLPYIFIYFLTGFNEANSTSAQQGWMFLWLVFNQISSAYGSFFSITGIVSPTQAALFVVTILAWSTPAIGEFVMVGSMILEFGTCSLSEE